MTWTFKLHFPEFDRESTGRAEQELTFVRRAMNDGERWLLFSIQ